MININIGAICPDKSVKIIEIDAETYTNIAQKDDNTLGGKIKKRTETKDMKLIRQYFPQEKVGNELAMTTKTKDGTYLVALNTTNIYMLYKKSWLAEYVEVEVFNIAFALHELAHVRYSKYEKEETAFKENGNESEIFNLIHNLLEDSRVEYAMSMDFPECSVFFNILLSAIQDVYKTDPANEAMSNDEKEKLRVCLNELNHFTRYNLIGKKTNKEFISQIVPPVLLARRGSQVDCIIAAEIIVNLLKQTVFEFDETQKIPNGLLNGSKADAITNDDKILMEEQFSGTGDMEQLASKYFDGDEVNAQLENQEGGSKAGSAISIENKQRSSFFLDTAIKRKKEIESLRNIFKRAFTEYKNIMVKEGELNFQKQQQAYVDSITGEEGFNFQYKKIEKVLVDVVVLRDVSGSTSSSKVGYAEALVIFLSALENLEGIRTAQIDFNGSHFTNKTFDTSIESATINPFAEGGTSIRSAYNEVIGYNFKGKKNLVIVFSDGDVFESKQEVDKLEEKIGRVAKLVKFGIGGYSRNGYKPVTIEDIPKEMLNIIIKEGLQ